jgi:hypothetical protein
MPQNIFDAESSFSTGKTRFEAWQAKFEESWNRPILVGQIATLLASIPPEVKERLPQAAIKALEDKIMKIGETNDAPIQLQKPDSGPVRQPVPGEPLRPSAQKYNG